MVMTIVWSMETPRWYVHTPFSNSNNLADGLCLSGRHCFTVENSLAGMNLSLATHLLHRSFEHEVSSEHGAEKWSRLAPEE